MARYRRSRSDAQAENLVKLVVVLFCLAALGIGGLAHFSEALIGLIKLVGMAALIVAVLAVAWFVIRHRSRASAPVSGSEGVAKWETISRSRLAPSEQAVADRLPTVESLREIDWYQFEKLVANLLELEGYEVSRAGGANPDGGVDVLATKDGAITIVQCKHWTSPVTTKTIQQVVGIRQIQKADHLVLATLNSATPQALALAEGQGIMIIGAQEIFGRMQNAGLEQFESFLDPADKHCPVCDAKMVLRNGGDGTFWGCSQYGPRRCRGTIKA
jgi:restriction system protein